MLLLDDMKPTARKTKPETKTGKANAMAELKTMRDTLKGLVEQARVQVHLGAMELKADAGPYLLEVRKASRAASKDLIKRGQALTGELKRIRAAHRVS